MLLKKFQNLSVARKMWALFLGLLLCNVLVAGGLFSYLQNVEQRVSAAVQATDKRINLALRWQALTLQSVEAALASVLSSEEHLIAQLSQKARGLMQQAGGLQQQVQADAQSEVDRSGLARVEQERKAVLDIYEQAYQARDLGKAWEAQKLVDEQLIPASRRYVQAQDAFIEAQQQQRLDAEQHGREQTAIAKRMAMGVGLFMGLVGALLSLTTIRSITTPLSEAVQLAQTIAAGDLSYAPPAAERGDELGRLMQSLALMTRQLRGLVGEVQGGVEAVAAASSQMAQDNSDLSDRTAHAAEQLKATVSSIENMVTLVTHSADSARHADQSARSAAEAAASGGSVVQEVVRNMEHMAQSSQQVAAIVGVIDGIAFQTNILALNAAVEAARAGTQGRGFAVVAAEVRELAQRSAEAAKQIRQLMEHSTKQMKSGQTLALQAGQRMEHIVRDVRTVSGLIASITEAAQAQNQGIAQISEAVQALDHMTSQNAGLVAESSAAARELFHQAQRLEAGAGRFRIDYQALDNEIADIEVDVMEKEVHVPRLAALEAEMA
ncbi:MULTISPECIES: methyl-accepting chemotaxis protein [Comamonas]|nr:MULTISPECIES: methyl-accepting chemotaxis protein [Comamonas]MCO8251410.1 methyl-accepting chemotaxis protein [Comamonas thiooxydans]UBQ40493.1 methyl-accepting chemotaxis protein [Comamonas thiooxydans]UNV92428.1 methyl-accepting chemotaxis protein [Comamonas sp. 7D-2evo1]UNV94272.1 methyl-accepting chemotaxis protein [Comamonas sp. 7D-2]UNW02065.1 methyl-accepting chemotaxis protein [Comamonas sp. 7D-2evo2]